MINVEALNPIDNIYTNDGTSIIDIKELPYFDAEPYDFNDPKSFDKYISDLERIVRTSFEYRQFINYLRNIEGMNECAVLDNVVNKAETNVRIEIHHSPFTLYDICVIVFRKRSAYNEDLNINAVAEEVLYLHYISWVGLIPLSATVHDMVHNAYLFIPTDKIRGYYRLFIESYYNYINPDLLDAIDAAEEATRNELYKNRMEVFNNHRIYVNIDGSYNLPQKDRIKSNIRNHIADIKSNSPSGTMKTMCTIVNNQ
jgi:hypothetical protein